MIKHLTLSVAIILAITGRAHATEICGNGIDDDGNGISDEGCSPVVCESPLSCAQTGMVSPSKGALTYKLPPDINPHVPYGPSIGFARTYQSQYAPSGTAPAYRKALGDRWIHSYGTWLDQPGGAGAPVVLHLSTGRDTIVKWSTSVPFQWDVYNIYQPGFHAQYLRQYLSGDHHWELKLLTGETIVYNSSGKLTEIWDTLFNPNKVLVAYDGNGMLSTVTDARTTRRLLFGYTNNLMTSVAYQILISSVWTTEHTTTYAYTGNNPTTVSMNNTLTQTNVYTSNYLTQIQDHDGHQIVGFAYDSTTVGKLVRVETTHGMVGFEYNSTHTSCTGKTAVFFNLGATTSCSLDADCGSGFLCGGKTGTGSTGQCFRAGRCLTVTSPSEDVVTTVASLGPPGQTCDGACTEVGQYVWTTGTSMLDLKATADPLGNFTSRVFNANGLVTKIVHGDTDSDPTNAGGARTEYIAYDPSFPGRVASTRRPTDLDSKGNCTDSVDLDCAKSAYQYNSTYGKVGTVTSTGQTMDSNGGTLNYAAVTTYTYNTHGQLTQIDGPLAGTNDVVNFTYFASTDPLKDGMLQAISRKKDATNFLTTNVLAYDFRGNVIALQDPDTTVACRTYDPTWGFLTQSREAMVGQTDCTTTNVADLTSSWVKNSMGRTTQYTRPDGSCVFQDYDSKNRLFDIKRRDDCNAASVGDIQQFTYDNDGLLIKIESLNASGATSWRREMTYYDSRKLAHVINPSAISTYVNFVYDERGLVIEQDGESSLSKTTYTINADNRITAENRYKTTSTFDTWTLGYSWPGAQDTVTDGDAKATVSLRDDLDRVVRITSPDLWGGPMLQVYDLANRRTEKVEAFGGTSVRATYYSYDNLGRLTTENPSPTFAGCGTREVAIPTRKWLVSSARP